MAQSTETVLLTEQHPSRLLLSSEAQGWQNVTLQRYQHPPGTIDIPQTVDHVLVLHLRGPVAVEERRKDGVLERRWSDHGQMCLTPAGEPVHRVLKGTTDCLVVQLKPSLFQAVVDEAFDKPTPNIALLPRFVVPDRVLHRLCMLLASEVAEPPGGPGHDLMGDMLSRAIALQLLRSHSNLAPALPPPPAMMLPVQLRRTIEYMREKSDSPLSLSELAALSGLSASHFGRAFRNATGISPYQYIIDLRIDLARELLEKTELSVIEISARCGFSQASHFAAMFRRRVGVSPRTWRIDRRS